MNMMIDHEADKLAIEHAKTKSNILRGVSIGTSRPKKKH